MGGIYSLLTVGFALILGVMKILNFAHCAVMMIAMYVTYWLYTLAGVDAYLSLIFVIPGFFFFGLLIQKFLFEKTGGDLWAQFILSFGLMLIIENAVMLLWGTAPRTIKISYLPMSIDVEEIIISVPKLIVFFFSVSLIISVYLFLKYANIGRAIRAASQEKEGAMLVGINIRSIGYLAFGLGTICAGVAGSLLITFIPAIPHVDRSFTLLVLSVLVVGGMKSFFGIIFSGLIIGVIQSLGSTFIPGGITSGLMVTFIILVIVLLFKPEGLFGKI
jgi:branched-chain amino acid transport system permease protein